MLDIIAISKPTEREYVRVTMHLYYSKSSTKILIVFAALITFGCLVPLLSLASGFPAEIGPYPSYILWFSVSAGILTILPMFLKFRAKKRYKESLAHLEGNYMEISNNKLKLFNTDVNSELNWQVVKRVTFSKEWIFFWLDNKYPLFAPKRSFNAEQASTLKAILQANNLMVEKP